ncbi:hypothetical protein ACN2WE_05745 [Streptomyces sp. cg28]|uniref:hypothetical protein n=1 Tax=Streptomyces sp. cg28 TaxID=3403457 RepID=UPI003B2192BD
MSTTTNWRPQYRTIAVIALLLPILNGCSSDESPSDTSSTAAAVCDGKLSGSVFGPLVGYGGITSEDTSRFHPTSWTAYGYCFLDGEEQSVRVSYLWRKIVDNGVGTSPPRSDASPTPSSTFAGTVDTFTVGSAIGAVTDKRAVIDIPCVAPGVFEKGRATLEVEVTDMPPYQGMDAAKRHQYVTAAKEATRYLAGDVFSC